MHNNNGTVIAYLIHTINDIYIEPNKTTTLLIEYITLLTYADYKTDMSLLIAYSTNTMQYHYA